MAVYSGLFSDDLVVGVGPHIRVKIAHIRDSNLIGQLIRSCLRQGCGYADFVNKSKYIITKKCIHDILTHVSVKYCSHAAE